MRHKINGVSVHNDAYSNREDLLRLAPMIYRSTDPRNGRTCLGRHSRSSGNSRSAKLDPQGVVYQIGPNVPQEFRSYWAIGQDILFIWDRDMTPRVGDAGYGHVLNKVPPKPGLTRRVAHGERPARAIRHHQDKAKLA